MSQKYPCLVLEYTDSFVSEKIFTAPNKSIVIYAWNYAYHTLDYIEQFPFDICVSHASILDIPLYVIPSPEVSHA